MLYVCRCEENEDREERWRKQSGENEAKSRVILMEQGLSATYYVTSV